MAITDTAAALSTAFRQLSDALHLASTACKDLEYTIPLLAANSGGLPAGSTGLSNSVAASAAPADKVKRKKDPNEPRRPPSSYLLFLANAREELAKSEPELKPAEALTRLAAMWKDLSGAQKAPYEKEAEKLKEAYILERNQYEKDHPEVAKRRRRNPKAEGAGPSKVQPAPVETPAITKTAPAASTPAVSPRKSRGNKDESPKSARKSKEKEPEKEKEKRKRK